MRHKTYTTRCEDCGSTDLHQGYDIMLPLNKDLLELEDFLDGEYNDFIWCNGCDNETQVIEEVDWE